MSESQRFNEAALDLFHDQAQNVPVYASYLGHIGVDHRQVTQISEIPFLPIRFFKDMEVLREGRSAEIVFESSNTGGGGASRHFVADTSAYKQKSIEGFEQQFGSLEDWQIFALLPGYLERQGSSLIYMVDHLIKHAGSGGGFYLYDHEKLVEEIVKSNAPKKLLIGVSFALLDLAEKDMFKDAGITVMETGGMKGRRQEVTRAELHLKLMNAFGVDRIASEYGMTELLSQAYSRRDGLFECPPWMEVMIRKTDDPFDLERDGRSGGINVIDLLNVNSCAFIATEDLGRKYKNGRFEVLGRFDHSEARGCNLMISDK